jgi:hypothetical protein
LIIRNLKWLIDNVDTIISALLMECPNGGNPTHCQLHELRMSSREDQNKYLNDLTESKKMDLYNNHKECFEKQQFSRSA